MEVPRLGTESGSGSNPSWSCNLCDSCGNPRSLTHCARPRIETVQLQRQCQIPNAQHNGKNSILLLFLFFLFSFLFFFCFFRAAPVAYGSPQTRGWIAAMATSQRHSHSNARSLTHWGRPGIEPASSQIPVGFVTTEPWWEYHPALFSWSPKQIWNRSAPSVPATTK